MIVDFLKRVGVSLEKKLTIWFQLCDCVIEAQEGELVK